LSSSSSSPSKDRSPPSIRINGIDATTTDDLFQFLSQNISPESNNPALSSKSNKLSPKSEKKQSKKHHREKRFIWITKEKRIVLPPGTQLVLTPTLAMPLLRYPPHGIDANITISTPFTIGFDAMGMTDNQNPVGLNPFLMPGIPSFGRKRRDVDNLMEPSVEPHAIHGGERAMLYEVVEEFLFKFGMDGKACLLRAICEMHESPLMGYGLLGEMLELFLTASLSPYSKRLSDYVAAEISGKDDGECWRYYKECPKSLFGINDGINNKYTKEAQEDNQIISESPKQENAHHSKLKRAKNKSTEDSNEIPQL